MGEGIIGMTKSVTYVARYSVYTSSATIGVVVAAVCMIVSHSLLACFFLANSIHQVLSLGALFRPD